MYPFLICKTVDIFFFSSFENIKYKMYYFALASLDNSKVFWYFISFKSKGQLISGVIVSTKNQRSFCLSL